MKPTQIARSIGYSTTTQLCYTIDSMSNLSTKAIQSMIENLDVNPIFIFMGKG